jgi:HK97 family phage portal protein
MGLFGLMTIKEATALTQEAVKKALGDVMPKWLLETADAEHYNLPDPSIYGNQADLYRKLAAVTQAVDISSSAAAVVGFSVYRVSGDNEPKDIPNHPFEALLRHPNPLDSRFEFLKGTVTSWMLNGNAYWWLNRESENAPPTEIWYIPPHMIQPIPDKQMYLDGYYYYPGNGVEMALPVHEIVHFKRYNPFSRFVGLSAIEAIAVTAMGLLGMEQWNTKLFAENNARLPGILAFKQMINDDVWEKLKRDTRDAANKREMMMLRGVGEGLDWKQNAVSQKEMEFLAGINAGEKKIMDTLAPGLYTWLSGQSTYANAGANRAAFNELFLHPTLVMMGERITSSLLSSYTKNSPSPERKITGKFEDVRFSDRQLELAEIESYAKTHTVDEIRQEKYGDEPIGDERGKLLVSQINAQSGGIQEPPPSPFGNRGDDMKQPKPEEKEDDDAPDVEEQDEPEKEEASKAALEELGRFKRWALKHVGKPVDFVSYADALPADVFDSIRKQLEGCKSETAVKAVFDAARDELKPKQKQDVNALIEAMRIGLQALAIEKGKQA